MKVNLVSFFENRLEPLKNQSDQATLEYETKRDARADTLKEIGLIDNEIAEEVRFKQDAQRKGLDVSSLDARIRDLHTQREMHQKRILELGEVSTPDDLQHLARAAEVDVEVARELERRGIVEASLVDNYGQCVDLLDLHIPLPKSDVSGDQFSDTVDTVEVIWQRASSNYSHHREDRKTVLQVSPVRHHPLIAPKSVYCFQLLNERRKDSRSDRAFSAVYVAKDSAQIVMKERPAAKERRWESRGKEIVPVDLKSLVLIEELFQREIESEGNTISLVSPPRTPLLKYIHDWILKNTLSEPLFTPCADTRSSAEIESIVESYWRRLAAAPWSSTIEGPLALLKYLVENNERVRFWNKDYNGLYGFRVRTRDHTWLVGECHIPPSSTQNIESEHVNAQIAVWGHQGDLAHLGDMLIWVTEGPPRWG